MKREKPGGKDNKPRTDPERPDGHQEPQNINVTKVEKRKIS